MIQIKIGIASYLQRLAESRQRSLAPAGLVRPAGSAFTAPRILLPLFGKLYSEKSQAVIASLTHAQNRWTTLVYAENVGGEFLSLRHCYFQTMRAAGKKWLLSRCVGDIPRPSCRLWLRGQTARDVLHGRFSPDLCTFDRSTDCLFPNEYNVWSHRKFEIPLAHQIEKWQTPVRLWRKRTPCD